MASIGSILRAAEVSAPAQATQNGAAAPATPPRVQMAARRGMKRSLELTPEATERKQECPNAPKRQRVYHQARPVPASIRFHEMTILTLASQPTTQSTSPNSLLD